MFNKQLTQKANIVQHPLTQYIRDNWMKKEPPFSYKNYTSNFQKTRNEREKKGESELNTKNT